MARDHGEYLIDLGWSVSLDLASVDPGRVLEHEGTQRMVVGAAGHILKQRSPRPDSRGLQTRRGRNADDQDWLVRLVIWCRSSQLDERLQCGAIAGQWSGADVRQEQQ